MDRTPANPEPKKIDLTANPALAQLKSKLRQPSIYVPLIFIVLILPIVASQLYRYSRSGSAGSTATERGRSIGFFKNTNEVRTAVSSLDGLRYPEDVANRHALGVMIENHPDSRPHFGLTDASVVYEAQAEGGITRFLAIYGPKIPEKAGPVRSARTYYLDWCLEYDCFYAHVGGNIDALDAIPKIGIKDLDQFRYGKKAYDRITRKGIATEHTMYAFPDKLYGLAAENKWPAANEIPGVSYKQDAAEKERPASQNIAIEISSKQYNTIWAYDPTTNYYARTMAGAEHKDGKTGDQIKSKVVIVQEVPTRSTVTRINEQGLIMDTVGGGKAQIFQDGIAVTGAWKKSKQKDRTVFFDAEGKEIRFSPGQRWITVVTPGTKITITAETVTPATTATTPAKSR